MLAARLHAAAERQGKVPPLDTAATRAGLLADPAGAVEPEQSARPAPCAVEPAWLPSACAVDPTAQDELLESLGARLARRGLCPASNLSELGSASCDLTENASPGASPPFSSARADAADGAAAPRPALASRAAGVTSAAPASTARPACASTASVAPASAASAPPTPAELARPPQEFRLPPLASGERFGDVYDVVLLVDAREQFHRAGAGGRAQALSQHLEALRRQGVAVEERTVPVGDAVWVARSRWAGRRRAGRAVKGWRVPCGVCLRGHVWHSSAHPRPPPPHGAQSQPRPRVGARLCAGAQELRGPGAVDPGQQSLRLSKGAWVKVRPPHRWTDRRAVAANGPLARPSLQYALKRCGLRHVFYLLEGDPNLLQGVTVRAPVARGLPWCAVRARRCAAAPTLVNLDAH